MLNSSPYGGPAGRVDCDVGTAVSGGDCCRLRSYSASDKLEEPCPNVGTSGPATNCSTSGSALRKSRTRPPPMPEASVTEHCASASALVAVEAGSVVPDKDLDRMLTRSASSRSGTRCVAQRRAPGARSPRSRGAPVQRSSITDSVSGDSSIRRHQSAPAFGFRGENDLESASAGADAEVDKVEDDIDMVSSQHVDSSADALPAAPADSEPCVVAPTIEGLAPTATAAEPAAPSADTSRDGSLDNMPGATQSECSAQDQGYPRGSAHPAQLSLQREALSSTIDLFDSMGVDATGTDSTDASTTASASASSSAIATAVAEDHESPKAKPYSMLPCETPREAAHRRKREAADRELARIAELTAQHMAVQPVRPRSGTAEVETRLDSVPWAIHEDDCASWTCSSPTGHLDHGFASQKRPPSPPANRYQTPVQPVQVRCAPPPPKPEIFPKKETADAATLLAWSGRDPEETPRQAAQRRKYEAADRDLAQLKAKQAEEAGNARRIGFHLRDLHARSFHAPFATSAKRAAAEASDNELKVSLPTSSSGTASGSQSFADESTTPGKLSAEDLAQEEAEQQGGEEFDGESSRLLELPGHSVLMAWQDDGCTLNH